MVCLLPKRNFTGDFHRASSSLRDGNIVEKN
jgi:hypothetical protein